MWPYRQNNVSSTQWYQIRTRYRPRYVPISGLKKSDQWTPTQDEISLHTTAPWANCGPPFKLSHVCQGLTIIGNQRCFPVSITDWLIIKLKIDCTDSDASVRSVRSAGSTILVTSQRNSNRTIAGGLSVFNTIWTIGINMSGSLTTGLTFFHSHSCLQASWTTAYATASFIFMAGPEQTLHTALQNTERHIIHKAADSATLNRNGHQTVCLSFSLQHLHNHFPFSLGKTNHTGLSGCIIRKAVRST